MFEILLQLGYQSQEEELAVNIFAYLSLSAGCLFGHGYAIVNVIVFLAVIWLLSFWQLAVMVYEHLTFQLVVSAFEHFPCD